MLRRLTDQLFESRREGRSGHRHVARQGLNRPRLARIVMYSRKRTTDLWISGSGQPTGAGGLEMFVEIGAHGLEEQSVYQSVRDFRGSGSSTFKLRQDLLGRQLHPPTDSVIASFDMN
jgi:hypothetical protein